MYTSKALGVPLESAASEDGSKGGHAMECTVGMPSNTLRSIETASAGNAHLGGGSHISENGRKGGIGMHWVATEDNFLNTPQEFSRRASRADFMHPHWETFKHSKKFPRRASRAGFLNLRYTHLSGCAAGAGA